MDQRATSSVATVRPMFTGGCLCGAVRWWVEAAPHNVHHCHCSMCRRWTGSAFATLVWFTRHDVRWHGERPVSFRSSPIAKRSHCGACGTPLTLSYDGRDDIAFAAGSLDRPGDVTPDHHYGVEGRLAWADIGKDLGVQATQERW